MIFDSSFLFLSSYPIIEFGHFRWEIWWWPFVFAFVKNMFTLMIIVIFIATVMVFSRFRNMGREIYDAVEQAMDSGKLSKNKMQRKWEEARTLSESENMSDQKRAVVIAEGILDDALRLANLPGDNLEKRLDKISDTEINFKEDVVWAYKVKEKIEAGETAEMDEEEIRRAFYILERTMKELNIL